MSVETEEREDLLADVRDLPETGCETRLEPGCTRRVEWRAVWHCSPTYLVCARHRRMWLSRMRQEIVSHVWIRCHHCGTTLPADDETLLQIVRFERA